jgi:hypothetical protein
MKGAVHWLRTAVEEEKKKCRQPQGLLFFLHRGKQDRRDCVYVQLHQEEEGMGNFE